jgi:hypothetical protein
MFVYIVMLMAVLERLAFGVFVYIVMLKVDFERPALCAACIHHNVKCSFWRGLRQVLLVNIVNIKVAFVESCVGCCLYTS